MNENSYVKVRLELEHAFYTDCEIAILLYNGIKCAGFKFYNLEDSPLTLKEVFQEIEDIVFLGHKKFTIKIKLDDGTEAYLVFNIFNYKMEYTLYPIEPYKTNIYDEREAIDAQYYTRLMLKFTKDFVLDSIEVKGF